MWPFTNNREELYGGAIYSSNATFLSEDSTFYSNYGEYSDSISRGGALYLDYSRDIDIRLTNFTDNKAAEGGAIFLYDTSFVIVDSISHNNGEFFIPISIVRVQNSRTVIWALKAKEISSLSMRNIAHALLILKERKLY